MTYRLLILFLILPHSNLFADPDSFTTIITREDIRRSGITRIGEIFTLLDHWTGFTINGQDQHVSVFGLSGYDESAWTVLVNGHRIHLDLFHWNLINQLPVSLLQIEKIIVIDSPRLYRGYDTSRGLIHIITDNPEDGWMTNFRLMAGNEINDPGPYEFTDMRSPNEERVGPDMNLVLGYNAEHWFFQGSVSTLRHRSTDTPIEQRIKDMLFTGPGTDPLFEEPTIQKYAGYLRGGFTSENLQGNFQGGITHQRDILFFTPYGRDIPVEFRLYFLAMDLSYSINEHTNLLLESAIQQHEPGYALNRERFNFDFMKSTQSHRLSFNYDTPSRNITSGIGMDLSRIRGEFSTPPEPTTRLNYFIQWTEKIIEPFSLTSDFMLQTDTENWGIKTSIHPAWQMTETSVLHSSISYSQRLSSESQGLWDYVQSGYDGLTPLDIPYDMIPERKTSSMWSAGIRWNKTYGQWLETDIGGYIRDHRDYFLSRTEYRIVQPHLWFEHDGVRFFPDENATVAGWNASLKIEPVPTIRNHIFYGTQRVISGSTVLTDAFQEQPTHRFRFTTSWTPRPDLGFWVGLRMQSAVEWKEFEQIDNVPYHDQQQLDQGVYKNTTGSMTHIDIGVDKSLWNEKIQIQLFVKNLLNQSYFQYPIGADYDMTFFVQLELNL